MTQWYISPTGNDSTGSGTLASPWATFSKAITSASSGDTINAAAGTYTWANITIASKSLTFIGTSGAASTILDAGGSQIRWYLQSNGANTFIGLTFQHNNIGEAQAFQSRGSNQSYIFTNCIFTNLQLSAQIGSQSGGIMCLDDTCTGNNYLLQFTGCLFYNITNANNTSPWNLAWLVSGCFNNATTATIVFTNNTFDFPAGSNITAIVALAMSAPMTCTFTNNIFKNNDSNNIQLGNNQFDPTSCITNKNNDFYGGWTRLGAVQANNITTDPLFVDPASANYYLRPTSPCLGTGTIV